MEHEIGAPQNIDVNVKVLKSFCERHEISV